MIRIVYHRNFEKSAQDLPEKVKIKLAKLIELLRKNPYNPLLHTKHLKGNLAGFLSLLVNLSLYKRLFYL